MQHKIIMIIIEGMMIINTHTERERERERERKRERERRLELVP